jgi:anaerobic selenocysteine-containing dehydrogenase
MREEFYVNVEGKTYAAPQYGHEIRVKIGEDLEEEKAVAMSKEAMEELGINAGDLVEVYGAWIQEARAVLSKEKDMTLVRLSKAVREKLPCSIGQHVGIRKKYEA